MGLYRFWLAITVVMFHMGGISWVSGRVAVFSFYCVSGYLIFRVLDTVYLKDWRHVGYFYINRFLRLVPLYAVVSILTYLFLKARGGVGFVIDPNDPAYNFVSASLLGVTPEELISAEMMLGAKAVVQPFLALSFSPNLIPQGWSIGVELCFYLLSPAAVWLCRRNLVYLMPLVAISAAMFFMGTAGAPDFAFMDNFVYKIFLASAFMFLLGRLMYFATRRVTWRLDFKWLLLFLAGWGYYVWLGSASQLLEAREPSTAILAANLLLAVPATMLVVFSRIPTGWERYDSLAGNLSYGIYLNQFLAGYVLLLANEYVMQNYGLFQFFGRLNRSGFGWASVVVSVLLAAILFHLVEHPIDRMRQRLKSR